MKILLLGKNGQLGWELQRSLAPLGLITALDYEELNLENISEVKNVIRSLEPEVIVNASAYTAVDKAESEPEKAFAINATIPGVLAEEARALNSVLIHYSTDYVFDGRKGTIYTEDDLPNPLNVYGQTKLAGEQAIQAVNGTYLILRTSWVYSLRRDSFVTKVLSWARKQENLYIVNDQIGNPTWARMLAGVTALICAQGGTAIFDWLSELRGIYHLAGNGFASRFDWAQLCLQLDPKRNEQIVKNIFPSPTSDYPAPAQRPLFSALCCDRFLSTFNMRLPDWKEALPLAMET